MKFFALFSLLFSLQSFAGEIKVMDISPREMFGYDRVESEFIFDAQTKLAAVKVRLLPSFNSEYIPQETEVIVSGLVFDAETGAINLVTADKTVNCANVKKKNNGKFAKSVKLTNSCKLEQRYSEVVRRNGIHDVKVQILEVLLNY